MWTSARLAARLRCTSTAPRASYSRRQSSARRCIATCWRTAPALKLGSDAGLTVALKQYEADRLPRYRQSAVLSRAVEITETPEDFARNYAAFSHWLLTGR